MKKIVSILLIAACVGSAVFAFDLSAGGAFDYSNTADFMKASKTGYLKIQKSNGNLIGFKGFFDAQYGFAQIGMNFYAGKTKESGVVKDNPIDESGSFDQDYQGSFLNLGLFAKYPFAVTRTIKIFPLLGMDFDIPLFVKYINVGVTENLKGDNLKNHSRIWLDAGLGADFFVTDKFFIRPQAMFGMQLNKTPKMKEFEKKEAKDRDAAFSSFNYKINVGIGAGYKF